MDARASSTNAHSLLAVLPLAAIVLLTPACARVPPSAPHGGVHAAGSDGAAPASPSSPFVLGPVEGDAVVRRAVSRAVNIAHVVVPVGSDARAGCGEDANCMVERTAYARPTLPLAMPDPHATGDAAAVLASFESGVLGCLGARPGEIAAHIAWGADGRVLCVNAATRAGWQTAECAIDVLAGAHMPAGERAYNVATYTFRRP